MRPHRFLAAGCVAAALTLAGCNCLVSIDSSHVLELEGMLVALSPAG